MLDRDAIARLIPHQGRMCLLSSVEAWTPTSIVCRAVSHADPDNPLRRDGRLAPVCGIEYGLQAMAVHGALLDEVPHRPGYLTSLRDVRLGAAWDLASVCAVLTVRADLLHKDGTGFIYSFDISAAAGGSSDSLLSGQAMIIIPPEAQT